MARATLRVHDGSYERERKQCTGKELEDPLGAREVRPNGELRLEGDGSHRDAHTPHTPAYLVAKKT
jgi:hypothetical protein